MLKLENIGFYTLSQKRAATASEKTPLQRCELILTNACNFKCPYCRNVGKHLKYEEAERTVKLWIQDGLKNIRFSGGEPTLWPGLEKLVRLSKEGGVEHVAISTNGSNTQEVYDCLLDAGVNDFSISLDACCAEDGDKMSGGVKGAWNKVIENIKYLSSKTYVTVGIVLTPENASTINGIIALADSLGVSDIRVIPAAQCGDNLKGLEVDQKYLDKYKILNYRVKNIKQGFKVRGIECYETNRCGLVLDDMAVMGNSHYPCIIYMREGGQPIGEVGPNMREERKKWFETHDTHNDPICSKNCLDVCVEYNTVYDLHHIR